MVNKDATLPTDLKDGDDFNGKTVIMGDDIDLGNKTWSPIGIYPTPGTQDESRSFSGTFDGNGKQIEGLSINITEYKVGIGLFGYTHDATIQNLTVRSGSVTGYDCVGAIVGRASSSITIVHCVNWASVNAWGVSGGSSAGGIVGGTDSYSTFIACENYGAINARGDGAGGIHGDALRDAPSPNFIACINHGNISSGFYAGGIRGYAENSSGRFIACLSEGTVVADDGTQGAMTSHYFSDSNFASHFHSPMGNLKLSTPKPGEAAHIASWDDEPNMSYSELNAPEIIEGMNKAINNWNVGSNKDEKCNFKYIASSGQLPVLVAVSEQ